MLNIVTATPRNANTCLHNIIIKSIKRLRLERIWSNYCNEADELLRKNHRHHSLKIPNEKNQVLLLIISFYNYLDSKFLTLN